MTTVDRNNPIPLYHQLKHLFLTEITEGSWKTGALIPAELDLAEEFGVSRATVRQALMALVQTGHLHRIQGRGTIVTEPKVEPLGALTSFTENMQAAGIVPARRTLIAEWRSPPDDVKINLAGGRSRAYYVERLLIGDGTPLGLQRAWYPAWLVQNEEEHFSKTSLDRHSLYEILQTRCGAVLDVAEETIDVLLPDADEARLLDVALDQPVMLIHRNTFDPAARLIESVELLYRSDRYRYRVTLSRSHRKGGAPELTVP